MKTRHPNGRVLHKLVFSVSFPTNGGRSWRTTYYPFEGAIHHGKEVAQDVHGRV